LLAPGIAKWDGTSWYALGSGLNNVANALAFDSSGDLYVGGTFVIAGTNAAPFLARALLSKKSSNLALSNLGGGERLITGNGTPGYAYALDMTTNLTPPVNWVGQATNIPSTQTLIFTNTPTGNQGYYRSRYVPQ
jgi:hypothetical protein